MRNIVDEYVRNCHLCKRSKSSRDDYFELLNLITSSNQFWTNITLNFVNELKDKNVTVLVVIDRLIKQYHFISCSSDDQEITVNETAKMLIVNVWKLHEFKDYNFESRASIRLTSMRFFMQNSSDKSETIHCFSFRIR